jgi:hypothetical protein
MSTHLSVDPSKTRFPTSVRQLFPGIFTSPKRQEALTLANRRFVEYKTVRNDVNIISDPNLHERITHIILDESLFHVVKNAPNEYGGGIVILKRELELDPVLKNARKA